MKIQSANEMLANEKTNVSKPGLERVLELLKRCQNPQNQLNIVHIVGTNGKGSVTTMLESIFFAAGYKTGVMRSPYMESPYDYYRINKEFVDEELYFSCVHQVCDAAAGMEDAPSEFELSTVTGLLMFAKSGCRLVFLEAGMGGKNDATHVTSNSMLTVVTHIAIDHAAWLGSNRFTILKEKMGIAGAGDSVLLAPNDTQVQQDAMKIAKENNLVLSVCKDEPVMENNESFTYKNFTGLTLGLRGAYQKDNMVTAIEAAFLLAGKGFLVNESDIRTGLAKAFLPYRFQILREKPYLILDGGHNPDCMKALRVSLQNLNLSLQLSVVTAVMRDKDYDHMYPEIDCFADEYLTVTANNSRACPASELAEILKKYQKPVEAASDFSEAADWIATRLNAGKPVLIVGSLYMMNDIDNALKERKVI